MYKGKRLKKLQHEKISEILICKDYGGYINCLLYDVIGVNHTSRRKSYQIFSMGHDGLQLTHISSWTSPCIGVDTEPSLTSRYTRYLVRDRDDFL